MKDVQFEQTPKAPQSKQRDLRQKSKGNEHEASATSSEEDIRVLYEKGKFHGRSAFKRGVVQQYNSFRVTRLQGAQKNLLEACQTLSSFHRAGVPRIQ